MGLFREMLQTKIHLETAQKLPKDHLADEVRNDAVHFHCVITEHTTLNNLKFPKMIMLNYLLKMNYF